MQFKFRKEASESYDVTNMQQKSDSVKLFKAMRNEVTDLGLTLS